MNNKLFNPTRLMIKRHTKTGLRYFCKTPRKNYLKYLGSGSRWTQHIKKHGIEYVVTDWVSEPFNDPNDIKEFAVLFSEFFDIVNSNDWANLKIEDGLEGGMSSQTAKEMWQKPGVKERRSAIQKEVQNRDGVKAAKRKNTKDSWIDEKIRVSRIKKIKEKRALQVMGPSPLKGKTLDDIHGANAEEVREKISKSLKESANTPEEKERRKHKMLELWSDETFKQNRSQSIKSGWDKGRESRSGLNHVKADMTVYTFIHESGAVENCTRVEMKQKHKIGNISKLISGTIKSSMGWTINGHPIPDDWSSNLRDGDI
jgi:hypothetical protein